MKIQIVGQENVMQKHFLKNVLEALKDLGCGCQLEVVDELKEILEFEKHDLICTPALIVNGHILCEGHVWDKEHIKHFLEKAVKENSG